MSTPNTMQLAKPEAREEMRDFVSRAVHDLREPLRAIRATSELLAATRTEPVSEIEARCLGLIQGGVDRMEILIRDIGEYCYGEVRDLEPIRVDLADVLREAQRQLFDALKQSNAVVTQDSLPPVHADFHALSAVLRGLIENACKFHGQAPPQIHVGVRRGPSEWILSVRDNGCGFDPRYKDLIFKPFERLDGKRYPGSGLGLARCKRIVEQHGGRIWAESKPGEGTTVWFTLPLSD